MTGLGLFQDLRYFDMCFAGELVGLTDLMAWGGCADKLPGTHALGASYLSMDTDGRVVRMDSCSKLLAPGLRLGWVTAAPPLLEKMAMHTHASLNGPNGICQVILPYQGSGVGPIQSNAPVSSCLLE